MALTSFAAVASSSAAEPAASAASSCRRTRSARARLERPRLHGRGGRELVEPGQDAVDLRLPVEVEQAVEQREQRFELCRLVFGACLDGDRFLEPLRRLVVAHRFLGLERRLEQQRQRLVGSAGAQPVLGDARRAGALALQHLRHGAVHLARDRPRHAGEHGLVDEVVGEAVIAKHRRGLELAPGIGEIERAAREHGGGEPGRKVGAGDRGDASEPDRRRAELAQAPIDQKADAARQRQVAVVARIGAAVGEQRLQGLENELRIAAGVARHRRGERRRRDARQLERDQQLLDRLLGQRRELDLSEAMAVAERRGQERERSCAFLRAGREHEPRRVGDGADPRQQLDAGQVGEVEIVDHRRDEGRAGARQRVLDGALEAGAVELRRRRTPALGHDSGELGAHLGRGCTPAANRARSRRATTTNGLCASPGRAWTATAACCETNSSSSRLLPMPASPRTIACVRAVTAADSSAIAAARPTSRGGRSSQSGVCAPRSTSALDRSICAFSCSVSCEGSAPSSRASIAAQSANAARAAARSPRR